MIHERFDEPAASGVEGTTRRRYTRPPVSLVCEYSDDKECERDLECDRECDLECEGDIRTSSCGIGGKGIPLGLLPLPPRCDSMLVV